MERDDNLTRLPRLESVLLAGLLVVLAWAPFPYGSNRPWAELALGLGLGVVLVAWSGLALTGKATSLPPLRRIALPVVCIGVALGWAFVQAIDLEAVFRLTGIDARAFVHPVWPAASAALGGDAAAYISVDPESTRHAIFAASLSLGSFLIAYGLARDRERASRLLRGFVAIAVVYAAVALAGFEFGIDLQALLMPDLRTVTDRIAGPFVNPNHLATFMSLGALAAMGLFVETLRQSVVWDRGPRVLLRTAMQALTGPIALSIAAMTVILAALLLSQSRGGVIAFLFGTLALIVALAVGRKATAGEEKGQRAMAALLVTVLGVAAAVSIDPLLGRVSEQGMNDSARASLAHSSLRAIEAAPLVGQGFGAFQRYYPLYADGSVQGDVDEAHNDVLETLADLGLPAGLAFMAAPLLLAGMCFAGCLRRRRDRMYPAIAFSASVVVGVHALVEFSLQVPAVAIAYSALLGLGVAQSWRSSMDAVR